MKPFLKKILVFGFVLMAVNFILNLLIPQGIQDERFDYRYSFLKENIKSYNTLFFGTSRTLRHVIPSVFDSVNSLNGIETKSFNLGTPANTVFETYTQYEYFLEEYAKTPERPIKYAFLEIHPLDPIASKNIFSRKSSYWVSFKNVRRMLLYIGEDGISLRECYKYRYYILEFIIRYFGFNYINTSLEENVDNELWLGGKHDGYIDSDEEFRKSLNLDQKERLLQHKNTFLKDTILLFKRRETAKKEFQLHRKEQSNRVDRSRHNEILRDMINKSKELNIELRFLIHPRLPSFFYDEVLEVKEDYSEQTIEVANPLLYNELWEVKKSFNHSHMDKHGAEIFTYLVAREIAKNNEIK